MALLQNYKVLYEQNIQIDHIIRDGKIVWPAVAPDYSEPFYVENTTNSDETLSIKSTNSAGQKTIERSYDATNWETLIDISTNRNFTTTLSAGTKMYLRCNTYSMQYVTIKGIDTVGGNIMSLLYGNEFTGRETEFPQDSGSTIRYQFNSLLNEGSSGPHTLKDASKLILPAITLKISCYQSMFQYCSLLTTAPALPATTLASYCYYNMFSYCTSLVSVPNLPSSTLASNCYSYMFYGCTALTTAPALPATTLAENCYGSMFQGCTALTTAPSSLPSTTLVTNCYSAMFYGCTALTTAPALPATTLASYCYYLMFYGCTALNTVKCLATSGINATNCGSWLYNVSATGTFTKAAGATWSSGASGIPSGWTVVEE